MSKKEKPKFTRAAVDAKVKAIVLEQLGVDDSEVTDDASFQDDLGSDSLDDVELIMAMEEEFNIEIADEDAEHVKTVKQAVDLICKHVTIVSEGR